MAASSPVPPPLDLALRQDPLPAPKLGPKKPPRQLEVPMVDLGGAAVKANAAAKEVLKRPVGEEGQAGSPKKRTRSFDEKEEGLRRIFTFMAEANAANDPNKNLTRFFAAGFSLCQGLDDK